MACDVYWTDSARNDVDGAIRYIALNLGSPQAASSLLDALESAIDKISSFPESCPIGTHRALRSRRLRKKLVKRYVLLYEYDGETVLISRVFHTLQNYARILEED